MMTPIEHAHLTAYMISTIDRVEVKSFGHAALYVTTTDLRPDYHDEQPDPVALAAGLEVFIATLDTLIDGKGR